MNLDLKYNVQVETSEQFFEVLIKIPKSDINLHKKNAHEINMIFNQIFLFSQGMQHNLTIHNHDTKKSLNKIIADLKEISKEVCWIKSIYKAIKDKSNELNKESIER